MQIKHALILASCAFLPLISYGLTRHIDNGETATISLSKSFDNHISVVGDKITEVSFPENTFSRNAQKTNDGSIYLKPLYNLTLPVYVTTKGGRHFTLSVKPTTGSPVTLNLVPNAPSRGASHWEKANPYTTLLETVVKDIDQGKIPPGYANVPMQADWQAGPHQLRWQLISLYRGDALNVTVFDAMNPTSHSLTLWPRYFYQAGVRAVSIHPLTNHHIKPRQHTRILIVQGAPA